MAENDSTQLEVYAKPEGGFRALTSLSDAYKKVLRVAYPATKDIADEFSNKIPDFVNRARQRVSDLVFMVQELKWEIEQARRTIVETNDKLHALLNQDDIKEDPLVWDLDEQTKVIDAPPVKRTTRFYPSEDAE
ncbi:hypothetical protein QBC41DRAFT_349593 [Cercophora samala]|uniref:Uncharacterized protein n=1 Tax=Cercophora samala TaxID=330535 RepID=A0AA39Z858_9PEZI|nr:hypothetical protein QBC41DRAFT_349593 [Cercophora samala]